MRIVFPKEIYEADDILAPYIIYSEEQRMMVLKEDAPQEIRELYKKTRERSNEITRAAMQEIGLDYDPDAIERAWIVHTARKKELEEAQKCGESVELTEKERLTRELGILQTQYEQAFGSILCFCGFNETVSGSVQEVGAFLKEMLLEALRQGMPYPEEHSKEAEAWERALLERLKREGKWPPKIGGAE